MKLHWDGNMADKYIKFMLTNQKTVIYIDEAVFSLLSSNQQLLTIIIK